jgi:hypothetical protein
MRDAGAPGSEEKVSVPVRQVPDRPTAGGKLGRTIDRAYCKS